tara:strand:- start:10 stop:390 length:381 start_codon:yes stop_codon:yes gene_type:complete
MEMKLFGFKFRLEVVIVSMIIGGMIFSNTMCGCITREGMDTLGKLGSEMKYRMSEGVHNQHFPMKNLDPAEVALSPSVPLPEGQLFFFSQNKFNPKCKSMYSGNGGNACMTKEQVDFIAKRGGNKF